MGMWEKSSGIALFALPWGASRRGLPDLFGIGSIADAVKTGEWIAAIFAGLAWAVGHPSTAAWAIGMVLIVAVFRKGWPFANVPEITTALGKLIVGLGAFLIVLGFSWRAASELIADVKAPVGTSEKHTTEAQKGLSRSTSPTSPSQPPKRTDNGVYVPDGGG